MTLINIRSVERILLNLSAWIYSIEFFLYSGWENLYWKY